MADTDLIERAAKAIDLFDAICNIHDPSVSAHDRRVRAMAKVLEAAPSPSPTTAAIGAGGQAVAVKPLDKRAAIKKVVGLCNRIPGSTQWNAAEFMFDELVSNQIQEVVIYRGEDGKLWVRPREEFEDRRFEALPAAPQPKGE